MTLMQHEFLDLQYIPRLPSNLPLGQIYQYNFNVYSTQKLSEKGLLHHTDDVNVCQVRQREEGSSTE